MAILQTQTCSSTILSKRDLYCPRGNFGLILPGHNTVAMTNNQTTGPLKRFSWVFARLPVGDALKFNDIGAARLEPDWSTAVNLYQSIAKTAGELFNLQETGISELYASAWWSFLRLTDDGGNTSETGLKLEVN